jgi:hypothetical protein
MAICHTLNLHHTSASKQYMSVSVAQLKYGGPALVWIHPRVDS